MQLSEDFPPPTPAWKHFPAKLHKRAPTPTPILNINKTKPTHGNRECPAPPGHRQRSSSLPTQQSPPPHRNGHRTIRHTYFALMIIPTAREGRSATSGYTRTSATSERFSLVSRLEGDRPERREGGNAAPRRRRDQTSRS